MRLFVAIGILPEIRAALAALSNELRAIAPQAKWVRAENLHVTLKFLGHTGAPQVTLLVATLGTVRSTQPVTLDFHGLGFFPNEKRPKILWAGMQTSSNLPFLAADMDRATHKLGFPLENRPFTPHLTLARFNAAGLPPGLVPAVKKNATRTFGSLTTSEFHLIESKLKPAGAEYTTVQSFPFVVEA
jgi:RNA 2',3'-cyclic 3'-phosphodiesterase